MSNQQLSLEIEIQKSYKKFLTKQSELLHYSLYVEMIDSFGTYLSETNQLELALEKRNSSIEKYNRTKAKLEENNKPFKKVNYELTYKLYFQIFEQLIHDILFSIYKVYPIFLKKDSDVINTTYETLFINSDIEYAKKAIIEKKVKELIQSNNISNIFKKFKSIFGVEIKIDNKELDLLILTALNRNIITHNNSVVNSIYLNEIKRFNLKNNYKEGDTLLTEIDTLLEEIEDKLPEIVAKIIKNLGDKIKQIDIYSKSI